MCHCLTRICLNYFIARRQIRCPLKRTVGINWLINGNSNLLFVNVLVMYVNSYVLVNVL